MYIKCCLFSFLIFILELTESLGPNNCLRPSLVHGAVRIRQRVKLVKFMCNSGYELVGNRYATCRNGQWDEQAPICVRTGCDEVNIQNGIKMETRNGAWLVFFCNPRHRLVGSPVIYCDGFQWNDTAPTCVDATAPPKLSCDFEETTICEWTQDELHDFDWRRFNKKTPSSFLFTGPSFDHTYGTSGNGYYMYIESTSRAINDSARLISPIYDESLAKNGCFSFYYHMFGRSIGGLRVYQKPESLSLRVMLLYSKEQLKKYLLFEKWNNQGDYWYGSINKLSDFQDNFQIIIEGVRGSSFTSDIAIDDVAILQGEKCDIASRTVSTPTSYNYLSCIDRCDLVGQNPPTEECGCTASCVVDSNCCSDFFEVCVFTGGDAGIVTSDDKNSPITEKLVAHTTTSTPDDTSSSVVVTTKEDITTTPRTSTTTEKAEETTMAKDVVTTQTTLKIPTTTKATIYNNTTTSSTTVDKSTTTKIVTPATTKQLPSTTAKNEEINIQPNTTVEINKLPLNKNTEKEGSSSLKTTAILIGVVLCLCVVAYVAVHLRKTGGFLNLVKLRARTQSDPEVRFLSADTDLDVN